MKIADSNLADQIKDIYISDHGNFYFMDGIIISELNEGITYTWEEAKKVISSLSLKYNWDLESTIVIEFIDFINRRYV